MPRSATLQTRSSTSSSSTARRSRSGARPTTTSSPSTRPSATCSRSRARTRTSCWPSGTRTRALWTATSTAARARHAPPSPPRDSPAGVVLRVALRGAHGALLAKRGRSPSVGALTEPRHTPVLGQAPGNGEEFYDASALPRCVPSSQSVLANSLFLIHRRGSNMGLSVAVVRRKKKRRKRRSLSATASGNGA